MTGKMTVQRRSLCTWTGMAIGFRAFYAVMVDGGQLYGSAWLAMLAGLIGAVPTVLSLKALRCAMPEQDAEKALNGLLGRQGKRLIALIIFVVLIYDTGAVISLMSSTAKYVAMPEANRNLIKFATALTATAASMMGAAASANAAVLWRRLAAALIVILIGTQLRYFRASWLAPVLGPGVAEIGKNVIENLTTAMYENAYTVYREYIQNSADSIDKAIAEGLIGEKDAVIIINIEYNKIEININDNAKGIPAEKFVKVLTDIADSQKGRTKDKGFRGIGRLAGVGYCDTLIFKSFTQKCNLPFTLRCKVGFRKSVAIEIPKGFSMTDYI